MSISEVKDVLIVGAGISGISAACHLEQQCPDKSYTIIEARDSVGGTWDLFRYPGIRSDSDMHTFGFSFKPWTNPKALADGPSILSYLEETIDEYKVRPHIQFGVRVTSASWDSSESLWTVNVTSDGGAASQIRCRILFMCSGYYNYDKGYTPEFSGLDSFQGTLIHPQHWPEDLDYRNKKVAIIGSGATAVTIVPAMANDVEKITMIQRSPSYVLSMPGKDKIYNFLRKVLPDTWAYRLVRWRNIRFQRYVYKRARTKPQQMKEFIVSRVRKALNENTNVDTHFTPKYDPWTQRLCLVPDSDLFYALNSGKAEVKTAQIDHINEHGVVLDDGSTVECDILVTATGLQLEVLGGVQFFQDGELIDFPKHFMYQGMMFSGVPNLIQTFGYINASWTLRADLNSQFVCDALKKMDRTNTNVLVPTLREYELSMPTQDWVTDFNPGYFQRALHLFPKQGDHAPWHNTQNYLLDKKLLKDGPVDDGVLQFLDGAASRSGASAPQGDETTDRAA